MEREDGVGVQNKIDANRKTMISFIRDQKKSPHALVVRKSNPRGRLVSECVCGGVAG